VKTPTCGTTARDQTPHGVWMVWDSSNVSAFSDRDSSGIVYTPATFTGHQLSFRSEGDLKNPTFLFCMQNFLPSFYVPHYQRAHNIRAHKVIDAYR